MKEVELHDDRGSASVLAMLGAMAVVALSLLLVGALGGAGDARRGATTAADAAALAAAQEWRDQIGRQYDEDARTDESVPLFAGRQLSALTGRAESRARELAQANGAVLESFVVDPVRAEVRVTTRVERELVDAERDFRAKAVARIEFRTGACRSGERLGLMVETCVSSSAEAVVRELTTSDLSPFEAVVALVR